MRQVGNIHAHVLACQEEIRGVLRLTASTIQSPYKNKVGGREEINAASAPETRTVIVIVPGQQDSLNAVEPRRLRHLGIHGMTRDDAGGGAPETDGGLGRRWLAEQQ